MSTVNASSISTLPSTLSVFWRPTGMRSEPGVSEPSGPLKVRPCSSFRTCAWHSHGGDADLNSKLALQPSSQTQCMPCFCATTALQHLVSHLSLVTSPSSSARRNRTIL